MRKSLLRLLRCAASKASMPSPRISRYVTPTQNKTADDQIAKRAVDIISWDVHIPSGAVDVLIQDNGWVTLSGTVDWYYQRRAAEDDVRKLSGVRGVTNKIAIKPGVDTSNVKSKIESALKRHAEVEAKAIRVTVQNGNKVVLEGKVDHWDERRAVENAAWSAGPLPWDG